MANLSKFTKRKIHSKWPMVKKVVVLSGNSLNFVNLLSFALGSHNSDHCLSLTQDSKLSKWVRKFYRKIRPRVSFLSIWWVSQSRMSAMLFKLQLEACKCFKVREILEISCGVFNFPKNNEKNSLISALESKGTY